MYPHPADDDRPQDGSAPDHSVRAGDPDAHPDEETVTLMPNLQHAAPLTPDAIPEQRGPADGPADRPADAALLDEPTSEVPVITPPDEAEGATAHEDETTMYVETEQPVHSDATQSVPETDQPRPATTPPVTSPFGTPPEHGSAPNPFTAPAPGATAASDSPGAPGNAAPGATAPADSAPDSDDSIDEDTTVVMDTAAAPDSTATPDGAEAPEDAASPEPHSPAAPAQEHATDGAPTPGTGADTAEHPIALWSDDDAHRLRERWRELQTQFIDDPAAAVAGAQALVTEAVQELADTLLAVQSGLDPQRGSSDVDTEGMRLAMRRYREFLDRVLAL